MVQIVHGMVEYANRYAKFAEYLVSQGYAVVAHDHRGHGMTKTDAGIPGYFADYGGWNLILEDLHAVRQTLMQNSQAASTIFSATPWARF